MFLGVNVEARPPYHPPACVFHACAANALAVPLYARDEREPAGWVCRAARGVREARIFGHAVRGAARRARDGADARRVHAREGCAVGRRRHRDSRCAERAVAGGVSRRRRLTREGQTGWRP
eukprot:scaffold24646_cov129-Isochrysis_galbana.AAC.3